MLHASWPDAAIWTGTLAEVAAASPLPDEQAGAPGVVVVGAVISVAAALAGMGARAPGAKLEHVAAGTGGKRGEPPRRGAPWASR